MRKKWFITGIAVFVLMFCLSWSKNTDFSQDLGRHLKLGEIIVNTRTIPATNLFSYTNPGFPFINHHWLAEVIFYVLVSAFGLPSLSVLRVLLFAGAILFALKSAAKYSNYFVTAFSILILSPLLMERVGIRPELFGYFFFSLTLYIIFFQQKRWMFGLIPVIMALWVNLHISFVFGLFLLCLGVMTLYKDKKKLWLLIAGMAALLLNPHGVWGAVEPFVIFRNYGYSIVENQTLFFLNSITLKPILRYYLILIPLVLSAGCVLLAKRQYIMTLVLAVFFAAGFWQIRHISFFVYAAIPTVALAGGGVWADLSRFPAFRRMAGFPYTEIVAIFFAAASLFVVSNIYYHTYDDLRTFGYGNYEVQKGATDFILKNRLPANLFNNFDIGGYAIYRLYPTYRVFVDNRPEAYPADFFQKVYIPLQEDDNLRKSVFKQYDIHTVYFAYTDVTPWGREFVKHVLADPTWKIVYANAEEIVMTDKTALPDIRYDSEYFQELIRKTDESSSLLNLSFFLSEVSDDSLVQSALQKAKKLNPWSCSVKRLEYAMETSNDSFFSSAPVERSWWCY